ncbi:hypothetical protein [Vibrio parahaemolyticus]|uniref:hypothetical protein n=2 Tax=Vibrio parahaemolyticus TaxID=670 RepID=UPI0011247FBF|nr:hypothetical protein [Vibrio parahaemolyticus]EHR6782921.1 hypothetical protein [Vibrio parahaemolyticus]TOH24845.1 hypothetical protein CGI83_23725 [Vibrio parahaemolyticus]HCG9147157.1 hypothetical protein [Vibrio parahaemolyticus]
MEIVTGEVSQVSISNYQKSEGTEGNKKQVTYQVHKFLLNGQLYEFERPGSALNIVNGNVLTIAVGFGKKVKRLYNVTTDEYSHKSPHSHLLLIFMSALALIGVWVLALKDLMSSFLPEYMHYAYILFLIVIFIQIIAYAKDHSLYRKLSYK